MGRRAETRPRMGRHPRQTQRQYRNAHIWYDAGGKQNFTAYKLRAERISPAPADVCRNRDAVLLGRPAR
jgi:hypothetical protein